MADKPNDLEEYKNTATDVMVNETLPREKKWEVIVAGLGFETSVVATVLGKYHAQFVRDKVAEEHGHAGVSFSVRKRNA